MAYSKEEEAQLVYEELCEAFPKPLYIVHTHTLSTAGGDILGAWVHLVHSSGQSTAMYYAYVELGSADQRWHVGVTMVTWGEDKQYTRLLHYDEVAGYICALDVMRS
jgi:hypothetical protein